MEKIKNKQVLVTEPFDFNNKRLYNLATPTGSTDGVNKDYVDKNAINYAQGTGLYIGGLIGIVDNMHFSITSGIGYIIDPTTNQVLKEVIFPEYTGVTRMTPEHPTDITISVGILSDGTVFQQIPMFSSYQRRTIICLGEIILDPATQYVWKSGFKPNFSRDTSSYVDNAILQGIINIQGNSISVSGSSMQMNVSSGIMYGYSINAMNSYFDSNYHTYSSINKFPFITTYHNGTEWVYQPTGNTLNPALYSNGTSTLQAVGNNKWSVRLIMRGSLTEGIWISYPTQTGVYADAASAIADLDNLYTTIPDELMNRVLPCNFLIVRGGATDLSNIADAVFVPVKSQSIIAGGSTAISALDVIFDNTTTTGMTSINAQTAIVELNVKIENTDFADSNSFMPANSGISGIYLATNTPLIDTKESRIRVLINGLEAELGDGIKTKDCFFSGDGGSTARNWNEIIAGDYLYWNGDTATFQLETSDQICFIYLTR